MMTKPWSRGADRDQGFADIPAADADARDRPIITSPYPLERHDLAIEKVAGVFGCGFAAFDLEPAFCLARMNLGCVDIGEPDALAAREAEGVAVRHIADLPGLGAQGRAAGDTSHQEEADRRGGAQPGHVPDSSARGPWNKIRTELQGPDRVLLRSARWDSVPAMPTASPAL